MRTYLRSQLKNSYKISDNLNPRPKGDVTFNTTENSNQCVVCATTDALIRRILVPREYRKHFPLAVHAKRDVVLLCLNCHSKNNEFDQTKRLELAAKYAAPVGGNIGTRGYIELTVSLLKDLIDDSF